MNRKPDASSADEADWQQAVAREATIGPLAGKRRLSSIELGVACRTLGLNPTRFYELLNRYRAEPVTSPLLREQPGPNVGATAATRSRAAGRCGTCPERDVRGSQRQCHPKICQSPAESKIVRLRDIVSQSRDYRLGHLREAREISSAVPMAAFLRVLLDETGI